MDSRTNIITTIKEYLFNKKEIVFAYIFGSFANSEQYHDIDIAIYIRRGFEYKDYTSFPYGYSSLLIGEISALLKTDKIDLIIMNDAGSAILQRIVNKGILLFDRDKYQRIFFENKVRKEYIDARHLRKIRRHYLTRKID